MTYDNPDNRLGGKNAEALANMARQELLQVQGWQDVLDTREMANAREGRPMDLIWRKFSGPNGIIMHRAQHWDANSPAALKGKSYTIVGDGKGDWAVAFGSPPNVQLVGTAPKINDAKRLAQSHFAANFA